tara:strand:+ start:13332 stop:14513 length:1182 start_codon:yes stop_codon:yes gene_type:complete
MGLLKITIVALLLTSSWSFSNVSFADGRLVNIATRGFVGDENDVLIAGFIIDDSSKKVLIRARGPSLAQADPNLTGLLNNPLVQLFNSSGQLIETNDDWQTRSNSGDIDPALSPTDSREAAILISLDPGAYTAIVRGVGGTTGIGIVEVFNRDPKQIDTGGIWNGTSTSNQGFPNQQLSMITTPDGRFAAISLTTGAQFVGNIGSTNDGQFSATGIAIPPAGFVWLDGSSSATVRVEGSLNEQSRFSATWELPATGESGTLNFEYDPIHQRDSSAEIFQGEWVTLAELALDQASGRILAQGTIDARFDFADGFFSGIDEFNCQYQGNILTRSTNFNIYNISVRVSGCEFSGNYTGLGAIIDLQSQSGAILSNRGLVFAVDNGTNYLTDVLFKN